MTTRPALDWLDGLSGVRASEPLSRHTTYRIGGPAERYLEVAGADRLAEVLAGCDAHGLPVLAIGNGSNLLVADAGVEGLVVRLTDTAVSAEGGRLRAAGGARMVRVAQAALAASLDGMEWALGIPGTVGGSTYNNAGCFGSDMAATVEAVEAVDAAGRRSVLTNADCAFRYRGSAFRDGRLEGSLVTAVLFQLQPGDPAKIKRRMDEIQVERRRTQPVSGRSTGSVFKNPPGDFAGRLVEAAGLKGERSGAAMVSREHANFIVNTGGASAADVAALVARVQAEVQRRFGIRLEPEMESVGRWPTGVPL
ncbi:MAG TPA: UDP-N-acetylmuramate dehydrogenase [Candidatus Solibacter sp.]|jgi:UDP-N-acetylmuramate dehydrogenase|nr:UDP-N-acetylmuramate dehydrogenase [Candidatus Solibacter sp.]